MEDLAASMWELAALVAGVKSTVDDSHSILKDLVAWKPPVDGAMQESSTASTTILVSAGVSMSLFMQQIIALKPDVSTPTTCSTDVLDIDTDAMRAKRDTNTLLAGLESTCTAVAPLPATTTSGMMLWVQRKAPILPARVVLEEMLVQTDTTVILASSLGDSAAPSTTSPTIRPWDPGDRIMMPWSSSCVCCQVSILEWIWQQQINRDIMISSVPSALVCGNSLDASSFYKPKYAYAQLDGKCTQYDFREQRSCIHCVGNLFRLSSITLPWDPGVCNELNREVLQTELVNQQTSGNLLMVASACDYVAQGLCTWALHHDHLGTWKLAKQLTNYSAHGRKRSRNFGLVTQQCLLQTQCTFIISLWRTGYELLVQPGTSVYFLWLQNSGPIYKRVQPIGVQIALLHHLMSPLQQKQSGTVYLGRILAMIRQLLHYTSDLVWCVISSSLSMPWDPEEAQLCTLFPRAPAWGQAGIEEGGNVTTLPITSSLGACEVSGDGAATPPTPSKAPGWTGTVGPLNTSNTEGNGVDEQNTETYLSLFSEPYPCFSL